MNPLSVMIVDDSSVMRKIVTARSGRPGWFLGKCSRLAMGRKPWSASSRPASILS